MIHTIHRLTAMAVAKQKKPGTYADGGNLWLQVTESQSKSWSFRFTLNGRAREMGLGPLHTVDLAKARDKARRCRELLLEGIDPIEQRNAEKAAKSLEVSSAKSFSECAESYIESHRAGWRNAKHADQWENTIATYCGPIIGSMPIQQIDTALVLRVLEPIWKTKTQTATRLRGRIENVLSWAAVRGYRVGANPARWKGHLDQLLARPSKVSVVEHHAALPFRETGAFMERLRSQEGVGAAALEFAILTAARSGEVRGAIWDEIDLQTHTWTISTPRL